MEIYEYQCVDVGFVNITWNVRWNVSGILMEYTVCIYIYIIYIYIKLFKKGIYYWSILWR